MTIEKNRSVLSFTRVPTVAKLNERIRRAVEVQYVEKLVRQINFVLLIPLEVPDVPLQHIVVIIVRFLAHLSPGLVKVQLVNIAHKLLALFHVHWRWKQVC